jgi:hypothetical protein
MGMPAMSAIGAHTSFAGVLQPAVGAGAAATVGLNAIAMPHNPIAAPIRPMLNRSRIVIDVDSFIPVRTLEVSRLQGHMSYRCRL